MATVSRLLVILCCLAIQGQVQASDIYRWVDDEGRTHLSDSVPDRYKDSATRVDTRRYELTPEQQREAQDRADRERTRSATIEPAAPAPSEAPAPASAAPPQPPVKRPVERVTANTDCVTWWRLYRESQECFGPFHTVGGGIKPEAFDHCNEVPGPEPKCGPYRY